ncbi:peptidylprolyl isomerase [Iodidimonas sp. SYSU 1G8]|uniref:peptidylprolyl isomerase n=1 Tax=Iodidimonas sp. SYSU 1G8 TaxID=3133967 RepID=UPI0031FED632
MAVMMACVASPALAIDWSTVDPENVLVLELRDGRVLIEMRPDKAPNHVARIKELTRKGFYDGLKFHRVIPDFMAQTGDPKGDGTGGSGQNLKAEFNSLRHLRGTVSMARGPDNDDSADSQFFIMLNANRSLDKKYTVWGRVIEGMEAVDLITKGTKENDGKVDFPDRIVSLKVAADMTPEERGPSTPSTPAAPADAAE